MLLDELKIGDRIRETRVDKFGESRKKFAERCNISENHLGKLERGEILISIKTLNKICSATGCSPDYILYGNCDNKNTSIRKNIDFYLDTSSKTELKAYFGVISSFREITREVKK